MHTAEGSDERISDRVQLAERDRGLVVLTLLDPLLKDIMNQVVESLGSGALETA